MDWFTNMFTPINERTDISPLVYAYRYRNAGCMYTPPLYNFTGGSTYNNGWNYFQNNNWRGSIFGFDAVSNLPKSNEKSNPLNGCIIVNFIG